MEITPPAGIVTFLFTDIEGSTRLLRDLGEAYAQALADHRALCREAFVAHGGVEVNTEGDAFFVAFHAARAGVAAAAAAQRALFAHPWPAGAAVRVRMGLHTGEARVAGRDYIGLEVHRAARIAAAAHGGQVLLSASTFALAADALPPGVMARELGTFRLKDIDEPERLFQLVIDGLPSTFPALRTLQVGATNLPAFRTSFVGRTREIEEAQRLLATSRLLTLTGPGGTGKTRLALEIGAHVLDDFADGVFIAALATILDPALVPATIALALGVQETGRRAIRDRVLEYLRDKSMLLVLDNFEHVLEAAPFVAEILATAPGVKILATSRARLNLYGEQEMPVPPLPLPEVAAVRTADDVTRVDAVRLFVQRAAAVRGDFRLTDDNARAIAAITERLDGLPLAIELAAAQVRVLGPNALLARLQQRTDLSGGARDLPERQRTLRGAIDWSYGLLAEPARRLFERFSVFASGADLEEIERVAGPTEELGADVLDTLATLVDHSLVRHTDVGGESRYWMLRILREYAEERLAQRGDEDLVREKHARTYLSVVDAARPHLTGPDAPRWLDTIAREHNNVRAALSWAIGADRADLALGIAAAAWRFWQIRGHLREGRDWLERALAMPNAAEDPRCWAAAHEAAGSVAYWQGDFEGARVHYEADLETRRRLGDESGEANALYNLAFVYTIPRTDMPRGLTLLQDSLARYRALGDEAGAARVQWAIADYHFGLDEIERSAAALAEATAYFRRVDNRFDLGWALHYKALIEMRRGNLAAARIALYESLDLFASAGDVTGLAILLDDLSELATLQQLPADAARLGGGAAALQDTTGAGLTDMVTGRTRRVRPGTEPDAPEDEAAAHREGRVMALDEMLRYARETVAPRLLAAERGKSA